MDELKEEKKERQISEIQDRIAEKRIGKTGSTDISVLTLLKIGDLLEENNRLLRVIAKLPEIDKKRPWWRFGKE